MNDSVVTISILSLSWGFGLMFVVVMIYVRWSMRAGSVVYGAFRMFIQLVLIGYVLTYIFGSNHPMIIVGVLCAMLVVACSIALRPLKTKTKILYLKAFFAITLGGVSTLVLVTQGVLELSPWYEPRYIIPLAGMIFANAMNAVSLAAERFEAEAQKGGDYFAMRSVALHAALIPLTNSLFAVGIVSLPGMMTGQILSGISPLVAARYQIMVMCMVFGAAGISSALYLSSLKNDFTGNHKHLNDSSLRRPTSQ